MKGIKLKTKLLILISAMIKTPTHFYILNHLRENFKLIKLAARLRKIMVNHKDAGNNYLNWKHSTSLQTK